MGRKRPQSARSTATSVTNGRSRSSGAITQSIKNKNKATESTKNTRTRHSLESSQPSRTKTRNSLEKSVKTRNGTETSKPIKSSRRSLPLENNFRGKKSTSRRSSSEHEDGKRHTLFDENNFFYVCLTFRTFNVKIDQNRTNQFLALGPLGSKGHCPIATD